MPFSLKERRKFALLCGLVFLHLILISLQVPKGNEPTYFERVVFAVFSPVQHGVVSFFQQIRSFWKNHFYFREVQKQNQRMRDEIFMLRQENLLLKSVLQNFRNAKEMQGLLSQISGSVIAASVVGFDSSQIYKSLVLNKGSHHGLKRDMAVLDKRGRLVGRVVEPIAGYEARVQLITDDESGVGVFSEHNRVAGILTGDAAGKCIMKYVLKTNREVLEGEEVMTSGYDGIYPSGIPVGKIISITEDIALFKRIVVEPYFDFSGLDQVAVLTVDPRELE